MKTSEFSYQEVIEPGAADVLFTHNGTPLIIIVVGFLIAFGLVMRAVKISKQEKVDRRSADGFFAAGMLVFMLFFVTGMFWFTAGTNSNYSQNDLDAITITEDYGVEVISVNNPPSRINRSNDKVSIKDVIVRVDGAVVTCQQYIIKKTDRYSVTCGENTPLESLIK